MNAEPFLAKLLVGKNLSAGESRRLFTALFQGKVSPADAKSALLLLARKGETFEEVWGCLSALRRLEPPRRVTAEKLMDTCGTGGDRSGSINVSTLAALVIAGAGGHVAKHGNRGISSRCGSSDLMEAFGVRLDAPPRDMIRAVGRAGIGYFHAPFYHPVFSRIQPLRRRLKTRTVFNLLGPLVNPLSVRYQLVGVSRREHLMLYARLLRKLGRRQALVCHSEDGMDEASTRVPTHLVWVRGRRLETERLNPRRLGFRNAPARTYRGGPAQKNRSVSLRLLRNQVKGPARDLVVLNAALGILVCGRARNLRDAVRRADESIRSGRAYRALQALIRTSRRGSR